MLELLRDLSLTRCRCVFNSTSSVRPIHIGDGSGFWESGCTAGYTATVKFVTEKGKVPCLLHDLIAT